ncbi:unnamed protein product [Arctogadus glacialis]
MWCPTTGGTGHERLIQRDLPERLIHGSHEGANRHCLAGVGSWKKKRGDIPRQHTPRGPRGNNPHTARRGGRNALPQHHHGSLNPPSSAAAAPASPTVHLGQWPSPPPHPPPPLTFSSAECLPDPCSPRAEADSSSDPESP